MTIPTPLQEALKDSITSGTFIDTKFWVFSKRNSKPGYAGEPKALFVNGHVAKRVRRLGTRAAVFLIYPRLDIDSFAVLDEREIKENLRVRFPTDRKPYASDYDYEDDSDLEEEDEEGISDDEPTGAQVVTEKPRNDPNVVSVEGSNAKSDESSDIISVSDLDSLFSEPFDEKGEVGVASSAHVGKVVVTEDVAFVTLVGFHPFRCITHTEIACNRFQALLRYLYTGEIEFASWGSAERRKARSLDKVRRDFLDKNHHFI